MKIKEVLVILSQSVTITAVIINEIAYKGSGINQCNGEDWIELFYQKILDEDEEVLNLSNYILHDSKGIDDSEAKIFEESQQIESGQYLILCKGIHFEFGIGSNDVISLLDENKTFVSEVALPGLGGDDETYAYFGVDNEYKYTTSSTPGTINIYTKSLELEEKLGMQNDAGKDFFLNDMNPEYSSQIFDKVIDINVYIDEESLSIINDNPTYEEYVPFTDLTVSNSQSNNVIITNSTGGGKIRTKGQSTLYLPACVGLKNVPFQIKFNEPFLGMETVYLRNHFLDQSHMRDYGSHLILKEFGLPYMRVRPVRLFINGQYIGFYTLIEAPTQGYVMQRSFGVFDPEQTALYKLKTMINECPFTNPDELERNENRPVPNPYYFERGNHRDELPEYNDMEQCTGFFFEQLMKEREDMIKGYLEYNETCGLAMVELGRIDRDYGAKSIDPVMISFLDSKMYNSSVHDLKNFVDFNQWIKNFAAYAVMLNIDSPINNINNWYLATTLGGVNDWRIVQWDHNNVASRLVGFLCAESCGARMIYWPILRPTCGPIKDHPIVGRILNDKESMQLYLDYVEEFLNVVNDDLLGNLRKYGHEIKEFIVEDPLADFTIEEYEESELGTDFNDYNTEASPFLKIIEARLVQVQAQIDAIKEGTLPRDGLYGDNEKCPDWRDSVGDDYISGSTFDESCLIEECKEASPCYENIPFTCSPKGDMMIEECKPASPFCDICFPYSKCGSAGVENSMNFVESSKCEGTELAECKLGSTCFDHKGGVCAYDGTILIEECKMAEAFCKPCFPYSRCGLASSGGESKVMLSISNILLMAMLCWTLSS